MRRSSVLLAATAATLAGCLFSLLTADAQTQTLVVGNGGTAGATLHVGSADRSQPSPQQLQVRVASVTSSSVAIKWGRVRDATQVRVYLASEPAPARGAPMPGEVALVSLRGSATTYRLTNLAAAAHAFIRVEAVTPRGSVSGSASGRTVGGPRAALDTPLREVHGYAPNVLQVVLDNKTTRYDGVTLAGNQGAAWQAGPWTLTRRDGRPIRVSHVSSGGRGRALSIADSRRGRVVGDGGKRAGGGRRLPFDRARAVPQPLGRRPAAAVHHVVPGS